MIVGGLILLGLELWAYDDSSLALIVTMICGFVMALVGVIGIAEKAVDHSNCNTFRQTTGYPTKFVVYAGGLKWTCYAKVNKNWLPTDQIREFGNK